MSTQHAILVYMPWVLSAWGIVATVYIGNRNYVGWLMSLLAQAGWAIWIAVSGTYGFVPMCIVLSAVYLRNLVKWWSDASYQREQRELRIATPILAKHLAQELEIPEVPRRFYHTDGDHV